MTTREPALRAVLFDSGGTLARPKRGRWWPKPRFEELIIDAGLAIPPDEETRAALDAGVAYLSEHTVIRTLEEELAAYVGCYRMVLAFLFEGFPPGLDRRLAEAAVFDLDQTLYEDTASALEELRAAGVMLGIVSNAGPSLELRYRDMGVRRLFDVFVISAVGSEKPEADIYQHALAQLPVAPEEVVYVDDVLDNVRTAVGLGMTGYVIDRLGTTPRQPDLDYVTDLFELLDVLGLRWAP